MGVATKTVNLKSNLMAPQVFGALSQLYTETASCAEIESVITGDEVC